MNGIDKIINHIKAESDAECEAIAKNAAAECGRIRAEYAQTEQDEYWKMINVGSKEAERRLERLSSLAALEAKKQILATQQRMIAAAFELAAQKLTELPKEEYIVFLAKLAFDASLTGTEAIILSEPDLRDVGKEVLSEANRALRDAGMTDSLTLSKTTADIRGGLILSGGDIEVNCSVDALISQYKNALSPLVAAELLD